MRCKWSAFSLQLSVGSTHAGFRELKVWQRSHQLTLRIYEITMTFPDYEKFGLANQMRRSAASIPTNLAEGCGRATSADMARLVNVAMGSACEVQYQALLANELGYIDAPAARELDGEIQEIKQMLSGLHRHLVAQQKR